MTKFPLEVEPVVPRYPGSKRLHALRYLRLKSPCAVIEPYLGAGYFSLYSQSPQKWVAEADYGLRSLWELWYEERTDEILRSFGRIKEFPWVSKSVYSWLHLKELWQMSRAGFLDPALSAAVALAIRKLTQNGTVRCNRKGGLNITVVREQVSKYLTYTPTFPPVIGEWYIFSNAIECIRAYNQSDLDGWSVALIDPPYYRPGGLGSRRGTGSMTPSYADHDPNDPATIDLFTKPIVELGNNPFVEWIVGTNYYSPELDDLTREAVNTPWYRPRKIKKIVDNGSLDSMNGKGWSDRGSKVVDPVAQFTIWGEPEKGEETQEKVSECPKAIEVEYWIE